jgi:hypothetical protein
MDEDPYPMAVFWTIVVDVLLLVCVLVFIVFGNFGIAAASDRCFDNPACDAEIAIGSSVAFLGVISVYIVAVFLGIRFLITRRGIPYYLIAVIPIGAFVAMFVPYFVGLGIAGVV